MKKVSVGLDVERELRYDINAVVELEERFDVPLGQLFNKEKVGIGLLRALTYIGLKHGGMKFRGDNHENELEVGLLIFEHWIAKGRTLVELMDKVGDALTAAAIFPKEDEEGGIVKPDPKQGAGKS